MTSDQNNKLFLSTTMNKWIILNFLYLIILYYTVIHVRTSTQITRKGLQSGHSLFAMPSWNKCNFKKRNAKFALFIGLYSNFFSFSKQNNFEKIKKDAILTQFIKGCGVGANAYWVFLIENTIYTISNNYKHTSIYLLILIVQKSNF